VAYEIVSHPENENPDINIVISISFYDDFFSNVFSACESPFYGVFFFYRKAFTSSF